MDLSSLPQHQKVATVAHVLREEIVLKGQYGTAGQLPTEPELMDRFGVARETVRRALQLLKDTGVVASVQGRGTFVRERPRRATLQRELRPQGGHVDRTDHGAEPWIPLHRGARWKRGTVPLALTECLCLDGKVAIWTSLLGDAKTGTPLQLARTYVPLHVVEKLPSIEEDSTGGAAVLKRLAATGPALSWQLEVGARMPEPAEASQLNTPIGIPLIQTLRITRQAGRVVEATESVVSSERFRIAYLMQDDSGTPDSSAERH
ncbi:GntR family transcriptional regulator [Streptomyces sp. NPDC058256]|uniref:GntR family transcriptional regulator n=1 Tax=Streptomyces sp. NPDC058256 TaxID=3346408 RepID=UPI0036EC75EB